MKHNMHLTILPWTTLQGRESEICAVAVSYPLSLQNNRFIANELRESSEGAQSDTAITLPLHERFASPKEARKFMRQT